MRQTGLELLDDRARRAYRARLVELDTELAAADVWADVGRSGRLSDEREALLAQLSGAAGLGGRRRASGSTDERARVAVRKAIVAAVARVAEADPWLGRHLRDRVRTGHECRYEADPTTRSGGCFSQLEGDRSRHKHTLSAFERSGRRMSKAPRSSIVNEAAVTAQRPSALQMPCALVSPVVSAVAIRWAVSARTIRDRGARRPIGAPSGSGIPM